MAWSAHTGQPISMEQYSIYPRALADENSNPHKSPKSNWTNKLKTRYESEFTQFFATELSSAPELVIIDAMFKPLRNIRSIVDYSSFYLQGLSKSIVQKEYHRYIYFLTIRWQHLNTKLFEHHRCYLSSNAKNNIPLPGNFRIAKFSRFYEFLLSREIIAMPHLYIAHVDHSRNFISRKFSDTKISQYMVHEHTELRFFFFLSFILSSFIILLPTKLSLSYQSLLS